MSISEIKEGDWVCPSSTNHAEVILKQSEGNKNLGPPPWRVRHVDGGFVSLENYLGGFFIHRFKKVPPLTANLEDCL